MRRENGRGKKPGSHALEEAASLKGDWETRAGERSPDDIRNIFKHISCSGTSLFYIIRCMSVMIHLKNMVLLSQKEVKLLVCVNAMAGKTPAKWPPAPPLTKRAQDS